MLRLRVTTDCQPRTKNGQPAHSTTGVAKRELDPVRQRLIDEAVTADDVRAHLEREHRQRQHEADPEAPGHVGEFGIRARVGGRDLGLERHAADRAGAGADLPDLRMHRAGVDRAFRHRLGGALPPCRGTSRDRPRTWCGSRPSRNNRCGPCARGDAWRCADRPSCRRPDRRTPCSRPRARDDARDASTSRHSSSRLKQIPHGGI